MPVHVIENAGPPSSAPSALGIHFIDTVSGIHYFSTGTSTVADWAREDKVIEDTVDPSLAPPAIGLHWVNTSSGVEFFSTGTATVADWKERGAGGGGGGGASGHPATRDYAIVVYNDNDAPGALGHFIVSADGGYTWERTGEPDNAAPGAGDRLLGNADFFGITIKSERQAFGVGPGFFMFSSDEYGGLPDRQYIRCTMDQGATWENLAQGLDSDTNSGAAQGGTGSYRNQFMNVAWDGALHYQVMCHETGTNDYIIESLDGGANWARKVISGSWLTTVETINNYPVEGGMWYAFGAWWAATQFWDGAAAGTVEIHKSTDGGATWTSFHTFNLAVRQGWAQNVSTGSEGQGTGVVVDPALGVFFFIHNQTNLTAEVWRQVDAVTPPALVLDSRPAIDAAIGSTPSLTTFEAYGKGRVEDGLTNRVFVQIKASSNLGWYQCYTEDGTTWEVNGYVSINENYLVRGNSFNDWDGYGFIWHVYNGAERGFYYTKDGILALPHTTLSLRVGEHSPGELLLYTDGDADRWAAVVDRP